MGIVRVLVVEDGFEYLETYSRFLAQGFVWERAGSGREALPRLAGEAWDAVVLDMCFDRVPPEALLGDLPSIADRFNGDADQARTFLETHQGLYVLEAIREAGHRLPVLLSHDFEDEPRRWSRIYQRHQPLDYLPDNVGPAEVARRIRQLMGPP